MCANATSAGDIRGHDFRQSGFLAASELRRIKQRHEQFVRALAARLAIFLRLEFTLQLSKVQIVSYEKFTDDLPSPTHITLFKTDPLKGVGLLVIPPRLGLTLVDRLLGGPGQTPEESRELSEIETALTDQVATLILAEWCNHWPEMRDLRPSLLGHENNSHFLQTSPPETAMLILTLERRHRRTVGADPAGVSLHDRRAAHASADSVAARIRRRCRRAAARLKWNAEFDDVKVPVVAEWQGLKMSAGEITRLKPGDVVATRPRLRRASAIALEPGAEIHRPARHVRPANGPCN